MKRKMAWVGFSYLLGLFAASFFGVYQNIAILSASVAITAVISGFFKNIRAACLTVGICVSLALLSNVLYTVFVFDKTVAYSGKVVEFCGTVEDYSISSNDKMTLTLKGRINNAQSARLFVYTDITGVDYGDEISFTGKVNQIKDSVGFESEKYYKPRGIYLNCFETSDLTVVPNSFSVKKYILKYRDWLFESINRILPADEGAFLGAMLCGDKSLMSDSLKLSLYRVGIGHIFSVSGTHLVIVCSIVLTILKAFRAGRRTRFFICSIFVAAFAVFSGLSSSVMRAAVMMLILLASEMFHRRSDTLNTLGICAVAMTAFDPYMIMNMSFVLSMAGAFSLGVTAPKVISAISPAGKFKKLKESVISLLTLSVCMFPMSVFYFNEASLISPLANLVLIPLCTAALSLVAAVAFTGGVWFIANPFVIAAGILIKAVLYIAELFNKIPFSYISTGHESLRLSVLASVAFMIYTLIRFKRIRNAVFSALLCCALICMSFAAETMLSRNSLECILLSDKVSSSLLLYKGSHAVIIDLDGRAGLVQTHERIIEKKGIKEIEALFINDDNVKSAYSAYKDGLSVKIKAAYADSSADSDIKSASKGSSVTFGQTEISVLGGGEYLIRYGGTVIECSGGDGGAIDSNVKVLYNKNRCLYGGESMALDSENGDIVSITAYKDSRVSIGRLSYAIT